MTRRSTACSGDVGGRMRKSLFDRTCGIHRIGGVVRQGRSPLSIVSRLWLRTRLNCKMQISRVDETWAHLRISPHLSLCQSLKSTPRACKGAPLPLRLTLRTAEPRRYVGCFVVGSLRSLSGEQPISNSIPSSSVLVGMDTAAKPPIKQT